MSTNGQLVFTDVDKITFKGVGNASNAVIDTLTGKIGVGVDSPDANLHVVGNSYVSTNLELGGTLIMGTVNVEAQHSLEAVTATGNITPLTIEFTNPTTSLVASGNVEVGGELTVAGNTTVSSNLTVSRDVVLSGNIYNNANLSVQYTTITPTLWTQVGQDIDGEGAGSFSGYSVSMSSDGTRVAIGGPYNDGTGPDAGHVRVYSESGGTWTQVGSDIDGEAASDWSGYSVSISSDGTRVAIGAPANDGNGTGNAAGHVRVYSESGGTWTQVGADIDGEAADDLSGWSVSLSSDGMRVAIGAEYNDAGVGHVRVYSESGGTWTQVGGDIDGEAVGDEFGWSVSMSSDGTRVAIGATRNDGNGSDAGHVRVYSESGGTWTQVGSDIDGEAAGDRSGYSVSMSSDGMRVAIGATRNDGTGSNAGHVRVYAESGGTWTQVGSDIDGEAADDRSGYSVSISSDGTRVAIGATYNNGTGTDAGHVRVYAESGGTWTQVGSDIDGEAVGDYFGYSVSMSSDGMRVAIGTPENDAAGGAAGHVRVFDWPVKSKKILKDDIVEVGGELIVSGNVTATSNIEVTGFVGSSGTGALTLPSGTTGGQPTGLPGMIRFNTELSDLEYYTSPESSSPGVTGGTITPITGGETPTDTQVRYKIHEFTSGGVDLIITTGPVLIEYLIIGGGGGGGVNHGGGGAGGGYVTGTMKLLAGTYPIVIGAGGNGGSYGSSTFTNPTNGGNSSAFGLTAYGGGCGGSRDIVYSGPTTLGNHGASGGGGAGTGYAYTDSTTKGGMNKIYPNEWKPILNDHSIQGHVGGYGTSRADAVNAGNGGGGGGAGGGGQNATGLESTGKGGDGGVGKFSGITCNWVERAGGGGGGRWNTGTGSSASGGGGAGGNNNSVAGAAGQNGTGGGGGGGGGANANGGNGGSGVVIVRYKV